MSNRIASLAIVLFLLLPAASAAQTSWAVAERPDAKIDALVGKLEGFVDKLPGQQDAAGVILYHQIVVAPEEGKSRLCENMVIGVHDPAGLPEELVQPRRRRGDNVDVMAAFVRSGSSYRRLTESEIVDVPGEDEIGRPRLEIQWGDLKAGDVIGWSVVVEQKSPQGFIALRLAERLPMVIASLNVQSAGKFAYELRPHGVGRKDVSTKRDKLVDGRPMVIKASCNQRAALQQIPDELPWPEDYPHLTVNLSEIQVGEDSQFLLPGWAATGGWNQSVLSLAGLLKKLTEDTGGLDITLSAITTGKTTNQAKTAAVCTWVRDHIELLEGPDISRSGLRELKDVFRAKKGTELEKALLMAVMLRKLDVPVTLAQLRRASLGPVDREWPGMFQFSDLILRTLDGETPVYWAPQCSDCEPGKLPAEWSGSEILTWESDAPADAEAFQEKKRKDAMREGKFDIAGIQSEVESQPWHRFETIPE